MPTTLSLDLRQLVLTRAAHCCEYCLVDQADTPDKLEIDHLIARKHGGQSVAENLALACLRCNRSKGSDLTAIDPETQQVVPLFNPRAQLWPDHFGLSGALIVGLTPSGRATVALLKFNLVARVDSRRLLIQAGGYPSARLSYRNLIVRL